MDMEITVPDYTSLFSAYREWVALCVTENVDVPTFSEFKENY